jgi:hypothetical protein
VCKKNRDRLALCKNFEGTEKETSAVCRLTFVSIAIPMANWRNPKRGCHLFSREKDEDRTLFTLVRGLEEDAAGAKNT